MIIEQLKQRLTAICDVPVQDGSYLEERWCPPSVAELLFHCGIEMNPTDIRHMPGPPLQCTTNAFNNASQHPGSMPFFGLGVYDALDSDAVYWWPHCWVVLPDGTLVDSANLSKTPHYLGVPWTTSLLYAVTQDHPLHPMLVRRPFMNRKS
ncbi:MAG: hypothetical protein KGS09_13230 [Nitrospirae bacterium]|nr:hypothetical protein [Nitrospirota bacterium]MDE3221792.1 hypothetical protein [Nitrospirota bacterium]